jgi:hypothetical protein
MKNVQLQGVTKLLAVALFGTATLFYSIKSASATTETNMVESVKSSITAPPTTGVIGKYQMALNTTVDKDGAMWYNVLAWDTETGKSKLYYSKSGSFKMNVAYEGYQLPANPVD